LFKTHVASGGIVDGVETHKQGKGGAYCTASADIHREFTIRIVSRRSNGDSVSVGTTLPGGVGWAVSRFCPATHLRSTLGHLHVSLKAGHSGGGGGGTSQLPQHPSVVLVQVALSRHLVESPSVLAPHLCPYSGNGVQVPLRLRLTFAQYSSLPHPMSRRQYSLARAATLISSKRRYGVIVAERIMVAAEVTSAVWRESVNACVASSLYTVVLFSFKRGCVCPVPLFTNQECRSHEGS